MLLGIYKLFESTIIMKIHTGRNTPNNHMNLRRENITCIVRQHATLGMICCHTIRVSGERNDESIPS